LALIRAQNQVPQIGFTNFQDLRINPTFHFLPYYQEISKPNLRNALNVYIYEIRVIIWKRVEGTQVKIMSIFVKTMTSVKNLICQNIKQIPVYIIRILCMFQVNFLSYL